MGYPTYAQPGGPSPGGWIDDLKAYIDGVVIDVTDSVYGADKTGVTDATTAIQAAINAVPTTGGVVYCPYGVYKINGTLDMRDKENLILRGDGAQRDPYGVQSGIPANGTVFSRASGTGTMLLMGATTANTGACVGQQLIGISFNCADLADKAVYVTSLYGGAIRDVAINYATTVALDLTTIVLSGLEDTQQCTFEDITIDVGAWSHPSIKASSAANAIGMRCGAHAFVGGDENGNTSANTFRNILIAHKDGVGAQFNNADSNAVSSILTNRISGGTAYGIELNATSEDPSTGHCRTNWFGLVTAGGGGVVSRATGFTTPARGNVISLYNIGDQGPGDPAQPVVEPGSTLTWTDSHGVTYGTHRAPRDGFTLRDDWMNGEQISNWWIGSLTWGDFLSTSGTLVRVDSEAHHPGIVRLATGATSGSFPALSLGANGGLNAPLPAEMFDMTWVCRLNTNDTNTKVRFGLGQFYNSDPSNEGIYYEKLAADTSWFGVCRTGGVQTRTSIVACDTSFHSFRVARFDATRIMFAIDNAAFFYISTNVPTAALMFFLHITNNAVAASKSIDIDYFECDVTGLNR